jgi:hypothetical protein
MIAEQRRFNRCCEVSQLFFMEDPMRLQKLGGWTAIGLVCVSIASAALLSRIGPHIGLTDFAAISLDPVRMAAAYAALQVVFIALLPLSILRGVCALLIALALRERMQAGAPVLTRLSVIAASACVVLLSIVAIAGMLGHASFAGSADMSTYRAFLVMLNGINATAINAFGWELLIIGWAALSTRTLPRILSFFILAAGIAHFVQFAFVHPSVMTARGVLAGISMIWLAVVLLRNPKPVTA